MLDSKSKKNVESYPVKTTKYRNSKKIKLSGIYVNHISPEKYFK